MFCHVPEFCGAPLPNRMQCSAVPHWITDFSGKDLCLIFTILSSV